MGKWWRLAFVCVVFVLVLPFVLLSWGGGMKPAEGFCVENGFADMGDAPTPEEEAASYFVSPELGMRRLPLLGGERPMTWPVCIRSRRGEHRMHETGFGKAIAKLVEPRLADIHARDVNARVLRVIIRPSFSRIPMALRL
jgi:hypothetical protein